MTDFSQLALMRMPLGALGTNCYVVGDKELGKAYIIDPATADVLESLEKHNLEPAAILLTHGHADHIGGVQEIINQYPVPVYIHDGDREYLTNADLNLSSNYGQNLTVTGDICSVKEGDTFDLGNIHLSVYETPGHTPGGVCYYMDGALVFVGDTLFRGSIGRTDFDGGDYDTLINAIKDKLYTLPEETVAYPGHGPETQIGYEKQYNPFVGA